MSLYDLIVRNGTLVTATGISNADLAVADGRIVAIEPDLAGTSKEEINAEGFHVFPGVIDAHVHFNEPGRTHWEGFATGTAALAASGTTTFFDMPLNAHPPTLDAESFDLKLKAAQAASLVDFALWGGLVPGNLAQLDELAERGVIGFKAFMSNSGIDDFQSVDDLTLYEGMMRAAKLGKIVAVHAESNQLTSELEAIQRAILFAQETGCPLHIVHISSGRGIVMVAEARARGIDVSCETCTHYLVLTEDDVEELGAVAKCAPPLRPQTEQDALWQQLFDGNIPMVTSDHSPAPADMKTSLDFFKVWGGISGCQSLLQLLLTEGHDRRQLPLPTIATITAEHIALRFGPLPGKGHLAIDADADLVLVDLSSSFTLQRSDLFYRHQHSPYVGRMLQGRIVRTLVRGRTVFVEGKPISAPFGRLVKPLPRREV